MKLVKKCHVVLMGERVVGPWGVITALVYSDKTPPHSSSFLLYFDSFFNLFCKIFT